MNFLKIFFGLSFVFICSVATSEPCGCFEDHKFTSPPKDEEALNPIEKLSLHWKRATSFIDLPMSNIRKDEDEVPNDIYAVYRKMYEKYMPKFAQASTPNQKFLVLFLTSKPRG
jgi:hypothetical protein